MRLAKLDVIKTPSYCALHRNLSSFCWRGVSVGDSKVSVDSTRVSCVNSSASVAWQRKKICEFRGFCAR